MYQADIPTGLEYSKNGQDIHKYIVPKTEADTSPFSVENDAARNPNANTTSGNPLV